MPCGVFRCISVDFGVFRCISVFTLTAGLGLGGGLGNLYISWPKLFNTFSHILTSFFRR